MVLEERKENRTIKRVEIERLSVTSSKPFEVVVAALKAAVGHSDMVEFVKTTQRAWTFAGLERVVQRGLGRTVLMMFMELGWDTFKRVSATIIAGGGLFPMKGLEADTHPLEVTVTLHEESASISPFGQLDWRMAFTPDRVAIETTVSTIVRERSNPRASFAGHILNTP